LIAEQLRETLLIPQDRPLIPDDRRLILERRLCHCEFPFFGFDVRYYCPAPAYRMVTPPSPEQGRASADLIRR
jgi:hypothetical protein